MQLSDRCHDGPVGLPDLLVRLRVHPGEGAGLDVDGAVQNGDREVRISSSNRFCGKAPGAAADTVLTNSRNSSVERRSSTAAPPFPLRRHLGRDALPVDPRQPSASPRLLRPVHEDLERDVRQPLYPRPSRGRRRDPSRGSLLPPDPRRPPGRRSRSRRSGRAASSTSGYLPMRGTVWVTVFVTPPIWSVIACSWARPFGLLLCRIPACRARR